MNHSGMKTFKIKSDIVAAHGEAEAIKTWAAHFGEDPAAAGPIEEIDASTYMVSYEQEDGSFSPGPLSDMIPNDTEEAFVVIDGDVD